MKEFKIKISKHKNKYIFTKLFMVTGLVFIISNTFIYNASAQAVVSNVYNEKESDSVVMKRELVNLCQQISEKGIPKDAQAMFKLYKIEIDCSDKQNPLPKVDGKVYSYEEFIKVMEKVKKEFLILNKIDSTLKIITLTTQDYIDILKKSMDQTIKNRNIIDLKAYSKIFSLNKAEWKKVLDAEKSKELGKGDKVLEVLDLKDPKYCIEGGLDIDEVKHISGGTTFFNYNYINFICNHSNNTVLLYRVELTGFSASINLSGTGKDSGSSSSEIITKEEFFKEYKLNKNETIVPSEPIKGKDLSKDEKPLYLVVFEKPLKLGSKGSKVKYMQNILKGKGYLNTSTGVYDKATVSAVKQFQKDNSLIVTGTIGKITFNKLSSVK